MEIYLIPLLIAMAVIATACIAVIVSSVVIIASVDKFQAETENEPF